MISRSLAELLPPQPETMPRALPLLQKKMGIKAVIVMPVTTPEIKVNSVKAYGAEVILHGDAFDQALAYSLTLVKEHGYTFIHPYDDIDTIAGQGTIGMEILRQQTEPLDAVFVPVGGGGLIAGISAYLKYLRPEIKVIGVEFEESACLDAALRAGQRVTLPQVGIFCRRCCCGTNRRRNVPHLSGMCR